MKQFLIILCLLVTLLSTLTYAAEETMPSTKKVIILLGPPGSGKGTQGARLSKELGLPHISTGDLFRENMKNETELGKKARAFIDKGQLVPDEIVLNMLFDRVSKPDCAKGYLLDGSPRTIPQAEAIDKFLGNTKIVALDLEVKDDVIVKRIAGRLSCKACGHIHNKYFSPPAAEGKCDKCGSALTQRSDDNETVVQERLKVYHAQTKPLIAFYKKKNVLVEINGEEQPDVVFKKLLAAVK